MGILPFYLAQNFQFNQIGFKLTAAFDINPELIGQQISGVTIYSVDELEQYLAGNPTSVGVLTVPRDTALSMAQRLVDSRVKGIWNFTNSELNFKDSSVIVENVHFADSLLTLSYLISEAP